MLTALHLKDFKSFADATLALGPFTVLVGTNASGKSNIRDAFRLLHGLGRGYTIADALGGRRGSGGQWEWEPVRGAHALTRFGAENWALTVTSDSAKDQKTGLSFSSIGNNKFIEHLGQEGKNGKIELDLNSSAFSSYIHKRNNQKEGTNVKSTTEIATLHSIGHLFHARFLEFNPISMRQPSFPGQDIIGDRGENLPTVLEAICTDPQRKAIFTSWLNELIPSEVQDLEFPRDPNGRVYLTLVEQNGNRVSAESASDGTLRFLGLLAALLGPNPASLYFLEEIETGIHPSRLHLLLDLIEHQTEKGATQVIATTHSADLLNVINDRTFANTSLIYRDPEDSISRIYRVADLPNADDLRRSQGLGRLLTTGWMETMIRLKEDETS